MIMWSAVVLFSLAVSCTADFAPPSLNISLEDPPETRWAPIVEVFDVIFLKAAIAEVIDSMVPKWFHKAAGFAAAAMKTYIPEPYGGEIRGMAEHTGVSVADIILLNFVYEITAHCTSIVAQDTEGNVYHGRNLDYFGEVLRNLTVDVYFVKKGEVAYHGTTFAGYVGLLTGQSPKRFTISVNQRGKDQWWNWWKNMIPAIFLKRSPVSWLVRETLEGAVDFQDAVLRLSKTPIITGVYYIVAGVQPREGVVITRDKKGPADIWSLDALNGEWYLVVTNFDLWPPYQGRGQDRRDKAIMALNATGQKNINLATLYQVLSVYPVCNGITVYTTTMRAAIPGEYNTLVRPESCYEIN